MATLNERERKLNKFLTLYAPYRMVKYDKFNYEVLKNINTTVTHKGREHHRVNECIIMADTETSKTEGHETDVYDNYVIAWTISIRAAGCNIVTLYGSDPRSHIDTLIKISETMPGSETIVYYHNLSYDWTFLRKFYFEKCGYPTNQLNTKSHYPISINFENGLTIRDSLILAQRSLGKWADDLDVPDKKATGKWEYGKIRNQGGDFTDDELEYIEHDTLAGVECLDATRVSLNKHVSSMPYTATGIVREKFRKVAEQNDGRNWFLRQCLDFSLVELSEDAYHGGYTHQNRYLKSCVIDEVMTDGEPIECYDIASSYPFALISEKYPSSKFKPYNDCKPDVIIKACENYAFLFTIDLYDVKLKDKRTPMPLLQYSKAQYEINSLTDNGRIVKADFVRLSLCDVDLKLLADQYEWNDEFTICKNVYVTTKDYLPKWFTDFVYQLFHDKTMLKGGDPVLYALAKAMLNSCYGMCCQHVMQNNIIEDYITGEYNTEKCQNEENYQKYIDNKNTFLPYQIGIWCTSYAMKNLFELGECLDDVRTWIYSDTDSCYAWGWNKEKLNNYNKKRINLMASRGYAPIEHNGRLYHLGIVELDKVCAEFKGIHSKCYAYRDARGLHTTIAGVPKSGAECLKDDINNFGVGFTFPGAKTGKLTHSYIYNDEIKTDENSNLIGDSVDLSPCDYVVGDIFINWDSILCDEVTIQTYEE